MKEETDEVPRFTSRREKKWTKRREIGHRGVRGWGGRLPGHEQNQHYEQQQSNNLDEDDQARGGRRKTEKRGGGRGAATYHSTEIKTGTRQATTEKTRNNRGTATT